MDTVYIRKLAIGEGRPKICVPICGKSREEILREAENMRKLPADLIEWRADWYDDVFDGEALRETLEALRRRLGDKPLLFTFRSIQEGGEKPIPPEQYLEIGQAVCGSGQADALDVELFMDGKVTKALIEAAHRQGLTVMHPIMILLKRRKRMR